MSNRLEGKTAIVIGAGQIPGDTIGNGRATAVLFALLSISIVLGCGDLGNQIQSSYPAPPAYWPTTSWQTSSPEEQGIDSEQLAEMLQFIKKNDIRIHSLLFIRNGQVILDAYFYPFTSTGTPHDVASVTKSVTSALIGIAIDKGYIQSVDQPVLSFFPNHAVTNDDTRKDRITVKNLTTMTSGFDCGFLPDEKELYGMLRQADDYVKSILELPMAVEPGSRAAYCSGNTHLLSAIITQSTGLSALEFAREHLFAPLGIEDVTWPSDPQGITHGWGDLHLRPHDMAKIGYLYLNGGVWNGKQILSSRWIEQSVQSHATLPSNEEYGYDWYPQVVNPSVRLYYATGRGGQKIYVWPGKEVILALTGGGYDLRRIQQHLLSSIQSDKALPENWEAHKHLQDMVTAITRPPDPKPVPPLPGTARTISGKRYRLEENMFSLETVSLSFDDRRRGMIAISRPTIASGEAHEHIFPIGMDDVYAISPNGFFGQPIGVKGHWTSPNKFVLLLDFIADINRFTFTLDFEVDKVTIAISEETGIPGEIIQGSVKE